MYCGPKAPRNASIKKINIFNVFDFELRTEDYGFW